MIITCSWPELEKARERDIPVSNYSGSSICNPYNPIFCLSSRRTQTKKFFAKSSLHSEQVQPNTEASLYDQFYMHFVYCRDAKYCILIYFPHSVLYFILIYLKLRYCVFFCIHSHVFVLITCCSLSFLLIVQVNKILCCCTFIKYVLRFIKSSLFCSSTDRAKVNVKIYNLQE